MSKSKELVCAGTTALDQETVIVLVLMSNYVAIRM